jgi:hypothetical protein
MQATSGYVLETPPAPLRVSRNLEKNLPEAPHRRRNFSKFATHRSTCLPSTRSTHVPDNHRKVHVWPPVTSWTSQTVPDLKLSLNCLAIFATSAQPPTAPPRRVPHAALAHRGPPLSPAPPHPRWLDTLARLLTSEIHVR